MAITFVPARRRRGLLVDRDQFLFTPERESIIDPPHSPATDGGGRIMRFPNVALIVLWTMLSGLVFIHWAEAVSRPGQATSAPTVRRAPAQPAPSRPASATLTPVRS